MLATLVIITVLTRCYTRIQNVLCACTLLEAESDQQVSPDYQNCWESVHRVSVCIFCAEIDVSELFLVIKCKR